MKALLDLFKLSALLVKLSNRDPCACGRKGNLGVQVRQSLHSNTHTMYVNKLEAGHPMTLDQGHSGGDKGDEEEG